VDDFSMNMRQRVIAFYDDKKLLKANRAYNHPAQNLARALTLMYSTKY